MKRAAALAGAFVFFWVAPVTVAGIVPWYFTRWRAGTEIAQMSPMQWLGALVIAAGAAAVAECFLRFTLKGLGTPAPVAPTLPRAASGLYRHVCNPMYVGVVLAILGEAMLFRSLVLVKYAAIVWAAFFAFVLLYEEPALRRQFGTEYERYRANVPRWWPRLSPWRGGQFRVDEERFDAILGRLQAAGFAYRSNVHGPADHRVNTEHGGRIVYWNGRDGHRREMLTESYARKPAG